MGRLRITAGEAEGHVLLLAAAYGASVVKYGAGHANTADCLDCLKEAGEHLFEIANPPQLDGVGGEIPIDVPMDPVQFVETYQARVAEFTALIAAGARTTSGV